MAKRTYGSPKGVSKPKSTKVEIDRRISLVYQFLKDGKVRGEIVEYFLNSFPTLSKISVDKYIARAKLLIANDIERDANYLVALHTKRYDEIYDNDKDLNREFIDSPTEPWEYANNANIVRKYQSLLQALKQKEDVYGLHTNEAKAALRKFINSPEDSESETKPFSLNFDFREIDIERLRIFKSLFDKMKVEPEKDDDYIREDDENQFDYQEESASDSKGNLLHSKKVVVEGFNEVRLLTEPEKEKGRITSSIKVAGESKEGLSKEQLVEKIKGTIKDKVAQDYGQKTKAQKAKEEIKRKLLLKNKFR